MPNTTMRIRLLGAPHRQQLFDAHLDRIVEAHDASGPAAVIELRLLRPLGPPRPAIVDGAACEVMRAERVPARLRFPGATWLWRSGAFERFNELPPAHGARRLFGVHHYRHPADGEFYWFETGSEDPGELALRGSACHLDVLDATATADGHSGTIAGKEIVEIVRRWDSPPPSPPGLVPYRPVTHHRFGGDPISIHLGRRVLHSRLFIGGLHHQRERRPAVDHVLNLCGVDNPWCERYGQHPDDRFSHKGEGPHGMTEDDLLLEGAWVAERLRAGRRVLVHCYAGVNRSATVCCAALILLEGIAADEALARVRQRHPIAGPDPYHWFVLRRLAEARRASPMAAPTGKERASLLREVSTVG